MSDTTVPLSQPLYGASFGQAVQRYFAKYATTSGRASRSEYWWATLAVGLVNLVLGILLVALRGVSANPDGSANFTPLGIVIVVVWIVFELAVIIPHIAISVRRLHDANLSGYLYLLVLIPSLGGLIVFIFALLPTNPAGARFDR
jgi:uncharacterized membrane protein YhaH (DUF805 family)